MLGSHPGVSPHRFQVPHHPGHVLDLNGPVVLGGDDSLADFLEIGGHGEVADHDLLGLSGEESPRGVPDGVGGGISHFFKAHPEGKHAFRVGLDLDLLHPAAHGENFSYARNGLDAAADVPVCEGAQIPRRGGAGWIAQADQHDVTHQGSGGRHVGGNAAREVLRCAGEAGLDIVPGLVEIGLPVELDEDEGERDVVGGAQAGDPGDTHEGFFQWNRDAGFHFLGCVSGGLGEDGDGGPGQVREDFDGKLGCLLHAQSQRHQGESHHDGPLGETESDEVIEHGRD